MHDQWGAVEPVLCAYKGFGFEKKDAIIVAVLSILYFSVSIYNLGALQIPSTSWGPSEPFEIVFGFKDSIEIASLYVLLSEGKTVKFDLYYGVPKNWSRLSSFEETGYYEWEKIDVNKKSQYIMLSFPSQTGEINEIVFTNPQDERIDLTGIDVYFNEQEVHDAEKIIDEQSKVTLPITSFSQTYFDEIYYVRAARDYIKRQEVYEQTHPPLGKLLIVLGTLIFGFNPNGWRIMSTLFATMIIPIMYVLSLNFFQSRIAAIISGFLISIDFMHLAMGRIATPETFVVFFNLASCLFFYLNYRNIQDNRKIHKFYVFLGFLFFSLAFSTKWYAIFGLFGHIFLIFVQYRKDSEKSFFLTMKKLLREAMPIVVFSLLTSVVVYLLTYVPYLLQGHDFLDVYLLQWEMFGYHSGLKAKHPFSSSWWSWPFISRPLWLAFDELPGSNVSTIVSLGNPLIWWLGIAFIILIVERAIRDRDGNSVFIAAIFLFQWIPFSLLKRCLFIYHFYINVPVLILAITLFFENSWREENKRKAIYAYLIISAVVFAIFYPVISGYPIPNQYRMYLRWLPSWLF